MNNFRELSVWKKAIDMVKEVYLITSRFPKEELCGLTNQIRRAAVSVPSNIAEGAGRNSGKEFVHFLSIALGSCYELETQFVISRELGFVTEQDLSVLENVFAEIQKMIRGLQKSIG